MLEEMNEEDTLIMEEIPTTRSEFPQVMVSVYQIAEIRLTILRMTDLTLRFRNCIIFMHSVKLQSDALE